MVTWYMITINPHILVDEDGVEDAIEFLAYVRQSSYFLIPTFGGGVVYKEKGFGVRDSREGIKIIYCVEKDVIDKNDYNIFKAIYRYEFGGGRFFINGKSLNFGGPG